MDRDETQPNSENQGATNRASPNVNLEEFLKVKELIEQTAGMSIEEFFAVQKQIEEQKRQQLRQELAKIEQQISELMTKKQEILRQLGMNKIPRTRTRSVSTGVSETIGLRFALDGQEMSASEIARQLGLSKASSTNWKRVFLSVLNGNSGGLTAEEQEEVRNRVSIIQ
jgi:hypothetical protein